MKKTAYKRILLKLSGESLLGKQNFGIDSEICRQIAADVKDLIQMGMEIGIVIGGGNIFRGFKASQNGLDRTPADQIGMLGTFINGIFLQQAFKKVGCKAKVLSAIACEQFVETFSWEKALKYLTQGEVVIFVGGTSNPYFTTDSAAALRAAEIQAEVLIKATKVDGIYDKDPLKHSDAVKFDHLTYSEALAKNLQVMDATAIALCRENRIPIRVFSDQSLKNGICNPSIGTWVQES